jgi:hypothetical protein
MFDSFFFAGLPVLAEVVGLKIAVSFKVRHTYAQDDRYTHIPLCSLASACLQFFVAN